MRLTKKEMTPTPESAVIATHILSLERAALDRWGKGDPDGYLALYAPCITYFDPFQDHRIDGLEALTEIYEGLRGQVQLDSSEIVDPHVHVMGDSAVLTMRDISHGNRGDMRWNCTEVYQRLDGEWKIVHSHWSLSK